MSSTKLRTLNAYPEWKTKKGIDDVIKFVVSIQEKENTLAYPSSAKTTVQKKRFMEKFGNGDFQVDTKTPISGGVATRNRGQREVGRYADVVKPKQKPQKPIPKTQKPISKTQTKTQKPKLNKEEAMAAKRKLIAETAAKEAEELAASRIARKERLERESIERIAAFKKRQEEEAKKKAEEDRLAAIELRKEQEIAEKEEDKRLAAIKERRVKIGEKFRKKIPRLYYRPLIEGTTNDYRIDNMILYPDEKEEALKELFDDLATGAGIGIKAFYAQVSQYYLGFTRLETSLFLKKQGSYNISRPFTKTVNRPVIAKKANERWSIDLIEMARYHFKPNINQNFNSEFIRNMNKENEGGKYTRILTCVDFFSKKVWTRALETGTAAETKKALNNIMYEAKTKPRIIMTDNGTEFVGAEFKKYLNDLKITQILTKPYASTSNGLIERVNRMVRSKIRDGFVRHNNLEWVKYLPEYTENINNQKPSRSKYTPNELWTAGYTKGDKELINTKIKITDKSSKEDVRKSQQYKYIQRAENQLKDDLRGKESQVGNNLKVGDTVRIKLPASINDTAKQMLARHKGGQFDVKYSAIKFTPTLYTIAKVIDKKPRRKRGESANDAEIRFKLLNPARTTYVLKYSNGNLVKEVDTKRNELMKTPKYFFKSDLQLIPEGSVPSVINTISRTQQLNRFDRYIPFVDDD